MSNSIACIITDKDKILIALRNPVGDMGNRWEFPGGKVDPGETDEISIVREMREEFGVVAKPGEKITSNSFIHKGKECYLNAYFVSLEHDGIEKPFILTEHQAYKWVYPDEIPVDNCVDSDLKILPYVLKAIELNPNYTMAYFNAGRAYETMGEAKDAASYYQMAIDLNRLNPELSEDDIKDKIHSLFNL